MNLPRLHVKFVPLRRQRTELPPTFPAFPFRANCREIWFGAFGAGQRPNRASFAQPNASVCYRGVSSVLPDTEVLV
jgi:hypothetical protein